jgi:GDP-4-dehydro-6-deoxy-D-mannose reductase
MKILVTGAHGFVGTWLRTELAAAGHEVVAAPPREELDVTDGAATSAYIRRIAPDAVAHLAAISQPLQARAHPDEALRVNVGGTQTVVNALCELPSPPALLVVGSSEVYGARTPLTATGFMEAGPVDPQGAYALSKIAQEAVAIEAAAQRGLRVVVTRSFHHTGPGQRPPFVAPSLALRALALRGAGDTALRVGNLEVRRDFLDVRDVVRAYRLLLEAATAGRTPANGLVVNVCSGRSVSIGELLAMLCEAAGVPARTTTDPALVRPGELAEVRGDASRLRDLTGWEPRVPLRTTLADLVAELDASGVGTAAPLPAEGHAPRS